MSPSDLHHSARPILTELFRDVNDLFTSIEAENPELKLQGRSWEDVIGAIQKAEPEYEAKRSKNKMRGFLRDNDSLARALQGMAEFIPDEKGLSVLRGGLVFMFSGSPRDLTGYKS